MLVIVKKKIFFFLIRAGEGFFSYKSSKILQKHVNVLIHAQIVYSQ